MRSAVHIALLLLCSACIMQFDPPQQQLTGVRVPGPLSTKEVEQFLAMEKVLDLGEQNGKALRKRFEDEWDFAKRCGRNGPFSLGVSLSGGGMRSAAFCNGVLGALHELEILGDVDIFSSVSGGAYTLSWYVLQHFYSTVYGMDDGDYDREAIDRRLFDPNGAPQRHLTGQAGLMTSVDSYGNFRFIAPVDNVLGHLTLLSGMLLVPVHLVADFLFDWNWNLNPGRRSYQSAIERTFHQVVDANGKVLNAAAPFLPGSIDAPARFQDVAGFAQEHDFPYFIINATNHMDADVTHQDALLANSVFEMTPLRIGSDAFGVRSWASLLQSEPGLDCDLNVSRAVSISGAAPDSYLIADPPKQTLVSAINLDTGYFIPNYHPAADYHWLEYLVPVPFYWLLDRSQGKDIRHTKIRLGDGGHSENLGAYSLIRRMCRKIIIIDGEHDPEYKFEAYRRLRQSVGAELGLEESPPVELVVMEVLYIKLHLPDSLENGAILDYLLDHKDFPQESTGDLNYSPEQFAAYRDLGALLVQRARDTVLAATAD